VFVGCSGPPKSGSKTQNFEKCNFVACDTVHVAIYVLIKSAFVDKKALNLSKYTVKQQLKYALFEF
jgi:hypothetical protein